MQLQDLLIGLSIIFVGPIVLGIIFYFIDELFKVFPEIERKFLIRLKCNAGQLPDPRKSVQLPKMVKGIERGSQRRNKMAKRKFPRIEKSSRQPYKDDSYNLFIDQGTEVNVIVCVGRDGTRNIYQEIGTITERGTWKRKPKE